MIEEALKSFELATDNLGTPLLDAKKTPEIWQRQQRHLPCLQDPEGTQVPEQAIRVREESYYQYIDVLEAPAHLCHSITI